MVDNTAVQEHRLKSAHKSAGAAVKIVSACSMIALAPASQPQMQHLVNVDGSAHVKQLASRTTVC